MRRKYDEKENFLSGFFFREKNLGSFKPEQFIANMKKMIEVVKASKPEPKTY